MTNLLIMAKKKFTEIEALEYCFEQIKPTLLTEALYNKFNSYRMRYNNGKLGEKAKTVLLQHFGFELEEVKKTYRKG